MPVKRVDSAKPAQDQLEVVRPLGPSVEGGVYGPELEFWAGGERIVIGVDEAGRGPLAGPVVAAAVAFTANTVIEDIGDSKMLTLEQRETTFHQIREHALSHAVVRIEPDVIDQVNILQATRLAMKDAVARVAAQLGCDHPILLVDGLIPPLEIGSQHNIVRGDSLSFSIGAASILAKVSRDEIMTGYDSEFPGFGFAQNKGYPTIAHRDYLLNHGRCPIHRCSFTIERAAGERIPISALPQWLRED